MPGMMRAKSLRTDNLFRFACPIMGAEVEMRQCLQLREMVWRGQGPQVRKGCQACMTASKCPIVHVMNEVDPEREIDPYFSATAKVGKLSDEVLKRMAPIIVPDFILKQERYADMPDHQRERIEKTNGLSGFKHYAGTGGASLEEVGVRIQETHRSSVIARAPKRSAPVEENSVISAAETGDMSAAVNAVMGE